VITVRKLGVRARWAVPAGVVVTVGIVIAASAVASAQSAPSLPPRSAAQLLADVARAKPLGAFTATIEQTSNLGLPALPTSASQDAGVPAVLTNGQRVSIWYADAQHVRVAVPVQSGESDLRLDGRSVWLWSSKSQTATHVVLPAHFSAPAGYGGGIFPGWQRPQGPAAAAGLPQSPLAAAKKLLAAIGPSTAVTVQRNVYVAGQAAYQLSIAPKASGSLVGKILIAIDASKYIPLRVQVFARGASSPAFAVGFTALTFGRPAMSNFSFTPPPGATVKNETIPSKLPGGLGKLGFGRAALNKLAIGKLGVARLKPTKLRLLKLCGAKRNAPTSACAQLRTYRQLVKRARLPKQVIRRIEASFARSLPKAMSQAQRAKVIKGFDQQFSKGFPFTSSCIVAGPGSTPDNGGGSCNFRSAAAATNGGGFWSGQAPGAIGMPLAGAFPASFAGGAQPTVIGKDWLSVVATPPSPALAAAVKQLLAKPGSHQPPVVQQQSYSSGSSAYGSSPTIHAMPAGPAPAVLRALLLATKPVHGTWGSGRLLTTSLVSVLITSNGRVLAGAVTPAVLYRDVAAHAG
jgi:hypothetical protein